ncbi:LysE family translocator [Metabacillus sp. 113a]|uniref:LysE family translocator n=1 Tax=Metabacillus sp. 113a TaxID=3404706 RepID=UPI003CE705E0
MDAILFFIKPLVLGISLAAPVGPVKLQMIRAGLSGGFWPSWLTGLGALTADLIFIGAILGGLLPFFRIPVISTAMTAAGAILLFKLGIKSISAYRYDKTKLDVHPPGNLQGSFAEGFFLAFGNPFNLFFWFGVYGSAIASFPSSFGMADVFAYSFFIVAGIFLWNLNVALTVHFARKFISALVLRIINLIAGTSLILFAIKLIWDFFHSF